MKGESYHWWSLRWGGKGFSKNLPTDYQLNHGGLRGQLGCLIDQSRSLANLAYGAVGCSFDKLDCRIDYTTNKAIYELLLILTSDVEDAADGCRGFLATVRTAGANELVSPVGPYRCTTRKGLLRKYVRWYSKAVATLEVASHLWGEGLQLHVVSARRQKIQRKLRDAAHELSCAASGLSQHWRLKWAGNN